MSDTHKAVPQQLAVFVDDGNEVIWLRQDRGDGVESVIEVHKSNLPGLISCLKTIRS